MVLIRLSSFLFASFTLPALPSLYCFGGLMTAIKEPSFFKATCFSRICWHFEYPQQQLAHFGGIAVAHANHRRGNVETLWTKCLDIDVMTVRDLNIINWYDTLVEDTVKAVGWFATTVWTQLEVTEVSGGKGMVGE